MNTHASKSFNPSPPYQAPVSPCSSIDDDEINMRVTPDWNRYRALIESHGYYLDTPDNLFRGTRHRDGKKLIVKAVGTLSDELDVIQYLSSPTLRCDPANHTIPVLDIIEIPQDGIAFIVQEEWASSFAHSAPCSPRGFLQAMRQCIQGLSFMHSRHVAHLDVSLPNILTNCAGSYAYIDFELSRRFHADINPMVRCIRGTELPPDIERGEESCPFKVDIWALGVTILRASKAAGYDIVELLILTERMLKERPQDRPSAEDLLQEFDRIFIVQEGRTLKRRSGAPIN
ncbi:hypothetical protein K439DRAFT_104716 [Ramaria rubella]|nr:hypothetical protein K439DRAFT_104716 [Ramaria rubella]